MRQGLLEVIVGGMFSGKTETLLRRLNRAMLVGRRVILIKHASDKRYSEEEVVSHSNQALPCILASSVDDIWELCRREPTPQVLGIDEAQFFGPDLPGVCSTLADQGIRVIVAGLDVDFRRDPFGPMPALMALAERVKKLHAVCTRCGSDASFSLRTTKEQERVVVGGSEYYEAVCRRCYTGAKGEDE